MYDVPFSEQWVLDLCLNQLNVLRIFIIFPAIVFICTTLYVFMKENTLSSIVLRLVLAYITLTVIFFCYSVSCCITGLFHCSIAHTFYKGVRPAHAIHAQIKQRILENKNIPQSLKDLQEMDPSNYKLMSENAKVNYVYDPKTKTYAFFVRPSKYRFVLFDSKNDYKIYEINQLFPSNNSSTYFGGSYPPDYPGPWDKLPE